MSKLLVDIDTALEVGIDFGRQQMAEFVISLCEISGDPVVIKRLMQSQLQLGKMTYKFKELITKASNEKKD